MAGVLLLFSLGCVESPRYSVYRGRTTEATQSLARLWGLTHDNHIVVQEMQVLQSEQVAKLSIKGRAFPMLESMKLLFRQPANLRRLLFLLSAQLLSQWSGTNAITSRSYTLDSQFLVEYY